MENEQNWQSEKIKLKVKPEAINSTGSVQDETDKTPISEKMKGWLAKTRSELGRIVESFKVIGKRKLLIIHTSSNKKIKTGILKLAVAAFTSIVFFTSCQSATEKEADGLKQNIAEAKIDSVQSSNDNLQQEKRDSLTLLQQFKKESAEKIEQNKKRIAELKTSIANGKEDLNAGYQKTMNELEEKNEELKKKLTEFKEDKKDKLEDFELKWNDEVNKLAKALKEIKIR